MDDIMVFEGDDLEEKKPKEPKEKPKVKKKFWPKDMNEWLILVMLIGVIFLAWAYWRDINALREIITNYQNVCSCP